MVEEKVHDWRGGFGIGGYGTQTARSEAPGRLTSSPAVSLSQSCDTLSRSFSQTLFKYQRSYL